MRPLTRMMTRKSELGAETLDKVNAGARRRPLARGAGIPYDFAMRCKIVSLPMRQISDWSSFHDLLLDIFGFPRCYGRSMNAWIDCLASVDAPERGLSTITVGHDEVLVLRVEDATDFKTRCPDQYAALLEGSAAVNYRRAETGDRPVIAVMLSASK
jgi:hypothetical protein